LVAKAGRPFEDELASADAEELFQAILTLESVQDCQRFFGDLATRHEIRRLSERWRIARLLDAGFVYKRITACAGASAATIARIKECLARGYGGFALVLSRTATKPSHLRDVPVISGRDASIATEEERHGV